MDFASSRRDFLASMGSSAWVAANLPMLSSLSAWARGAAARSEPFTTFTADEARAFEAVAAQILPSGDLPGAREAGAVYFADRALGSFFGGMLPGVKQALADVDQRARKSGGDFADLDDPHQKIVMGEIEQTPGFQTLWMLTITGVFAEPRYGGNRNGSAEELLDITHAPSYQPPFGYYDSNAGVDG